MRDLPPGVTLPEGLLPERIDGFFYKVSNGGSPILAARATGLYKHFVADTPLGLWLRSEAAQIDAENLSQAEEVVVKAAKTNTRDAWKLLEKRAPDVYALDKAGPAAGPAQNATASIDSLLAALKGPDGSVNITLLAQVACPPKAPALPAPTVLDGDAPVKAGEPRRLGRWR